MIEWSAAKKVLVIKLRHHGDVLLMTPLLSSLKRANAEMQVDVIVYKETASLLENNTDITNIIPVERSSGDGIRKKISDMRAFISRLRAEGYDSVILLTNQWRGALYARFSGAKIAVTLDFPRRKKSRIWKSCFTHQLPIPEFSHTVDHDLASLRETGASIVKKFGSPALVFNQRADDLSKVEKVLSDHQVGTPFVVVHPGSRWFIKCWEDDRYAAVIDYIQQQGYQVVLTGAPDKKERSLIDSILDKCATNPVNLCGQFSLRELGEIIRKADFMLGVDSLPAHLAAAVDTPSLILFGPSKLWEWQPWSEKVEVINARDYAELPPNNEIDTNSEKRYLSAIPLSDVKSKLDELLK